jgi:hypothetical protein
LPPYQNANTRAFTTKCSTITGLSPTKLFISKDGISTFLEAIASLVVTFSLTQSVSQSGFLKTGNQSNPICAIPSQTIPYYAILSNTIPRPSLTVPYHPHAIPYHPMPSLINSRPTNTIQFFSIKSHTIPNITTYTHVYTHVYILLPPIITNMFT